MLAQLDLAEGALPQCPLYSVVANQALARVDDFLVLGASDGYLDPRRVRTVLDLQLQQFRGQFATGRRVFVVCFCLFISLDRGFIVVILLGAAADAIPCTVQFGQVIEYTLLVIFVFHELLLFPV